MVFFHVSIIGTYIHDGRKSSAVACREAALVEVDVFYNIRVECGKKPSQMVHLIKRCAVQQKKILIVTAAMYIQPGNEFGACRHSRKIL